MNSEFINGLEIPAALLKVVKNGEWKKEKVVDRLRAVFRVDKVIGPEFYDLAGMRRESEKIGDPSVDCFRGESDQLKFPGDIEPSLAVIVASTATEEFVALDYRVSPSDPRVLLLTWSPARWIEIAPNVESFLVQLGCDLGEE